MANTAALGNGFKSAMLGYVNGISLKAALFYTASTVNATTNYSTTGEVSGGNYVAGGATVTNANSASTVNTTAAGDTQFWTPSASIVFPSNMSATAFDTVMIYNTSGNVALGTWSLGGSQTIVAGTVTLTMPTNDASTGLIRIS